MGVNIDELIVSQPDTGEQALEITEQLCRSGAIDIIVVDSVAALVPKQEIEGLMGDAHVGLQARLMSQALRKLASVVNRSNTDCGIYKPAQKKSALLTEAPKRPRADVRSNSMRRSDSMYAESRHSRVRTCYR